MKAKQFIKLEIHSLAETQNLKTVPVRTGAIDPRFL